MEKIFLKNKEDILGYKISSFVGAERFERSTSRTRTVHSIRTEPRPEQRALL